MTRRSSPIAGRCRLQFAPGRARLGFGFAGPFLFFYQSQPVKSRPCTGQCIALTDCDVGFCSISQGLAQLVNLFGVQYPVIDLKQAGHRGFVDFHFRHTDANRTVNQL